MAQTGPTNLHVVVTVLRRLAAADQKPPLGNASNHIFKAFLVEARDKTPLTALALVSMVRALTNSFLRDK